MGTQSAPRLVIDIDDVVYPDLLSFGHERFTAIGASLDGLTRLPLNHFNVSGRNLCLDGASGTDGDACLAGHALF